MKRVICLGSFHGNDRIGWDVAAALGQRLADADIDVQICATPAQLPALLADTTAVLLIDALAGVAAGSVHIIAADELCGTSAWSSHGLDLVAALGLARALGIGPPQLRIVGIGIGDPAAAAATDCVSADTVLPALWTALRDLFGPL